tara:strand:- start:7101 stop:7331 length:231 start_codon:yes stop_codon:yes gene_type:complete
VIIAMKNYVIVFGGGDSFFVVNTALMEDMKIFNGCAEGMFKIPIPHMMGFSKGNKFDWFSFVTRNINGFDIVGAHN